MAWELEQQVIQQPGQDFDNGTVMIAVPHTGSASFHFIKGLRQVNINRPTIDVYDQGHPVDLSRNIMVTKCLQHKCECIFFVDSDIILRPDTFRELYIRRLPIVSGVYFSRAPPYEAVANIGRHPISHQVVKEEAKTIEVEEVGAGCLLIDRRVFEVIAKKLNEWRCLTNHIEDKGREVMVYTDEEARQNGYNCPVCKNLLVCRFFHSRQGMYNVDNLSEDYFFCKLARENGFSVFLYTGAVVGHVAGNWIIDENGLTNTMLNAGEIKQ